MFFSKRANYGVHAIVFLHKFRNKKRFFKSKEIADHLGIRPAYLTKILQELAKVGVLESSTGPEGGFSLPEENADLPLIRIYEFLENKALLHECVLGWKPCNSLNPCPLHQIWNDSKAEIIKKLEKITVNEASIASWPEMHYRYN